MSQSILNDKLIQFANIQKEYPGTISNSISFDFKKHKGHIVIGGLIHGNEVGSLPPILQIICDLIEKRLVYGGKITFFLGNVKAALNNVRFLDWDLNRAFGEKFVKENIYERKRALELMPLLHSADVFLDLHQTIEPCVQPFYIFPMHKKSYYWAKATGILETLVTRNQKINFSSDGLAADEFVRNFNKPAYTIELGEKGFTKISHTIALKVMQRLLQQADKVFNKTSTIEVISRKNRDFNFLTFVHKETFNHPKKALHPGFKNLSKITANSELGIDENNKVFYAHQDGFMLFPKYPKRDEQGAALGYPSDICSIVASVKNHPLTW